MLILTICLVASIAVGAFTAWHLRKLLSEAGDSLDNADLTIHAFRIRETKMRNEVEAARQSEGAAWDSVQYLEQENDAHKLTIEILGAKIQCARNRIADIEGTLDRVQHAADELRLVMERIHTPKTRQRGATKKDK